MKLLLIVLLLWQCCFATFAQKEAAIWYFGNRTGFDFNANCQPTILTDGPNDVSFGVAVISDRKTGQLLFYTNGDRVWNREHATMPNGTYDPYAGSGPFPQRALIVPVPDKPSQYYIFRATEMNHDPASYVGLRYSTVDMTLDNGRGDVLQTGKDIPLADGLASRLTAIRHINGRDYWVLIHQGNGNAFLVYPVTSTGVGIADTIRIGSTYRTPTDRGFMKASPDGKKLACSVLSASARPFDLFDFDASTGHLSNYVGLGNIRFQYGVSFSPDNTKLYVTNRTVANPGQNYSEEIIRQYDLNAGSTAAVIASGKSIIYQNPYGTIAELIGTKRTGFYSPALQIGPDGRIYAAADYSNEVNQTNCQNCKRHFLVINKPNELGFDCDVQLQAAELGTGTVGDVSDLPNFMQHYFNGLTPKDCPFDKNDECTADNVRLFANPTKDVLEILVTDICFTPYTLRIVDVAGQVLAQYEIRTPLSQKLDVSTLAAGIYFAELHFTNRTTTKRFLKH